MSLRAVSMQPRTGLSRACRPSRALALRANPSSYALKQRTVRSVAARATATEEDEADIYANMVPCSPAFVVHDRSNPHYSEFTIDVQDYPGLLRVITWVMNGLGCRVHNAVLKTSEDGGANDTFWVTDLRGRKLSDAAAADVAERLEDFVSYCAPPEGDAEFTEFTCGDIAVSNVAHPEWTEVTITASLFSPGLLLELSSIFHGQGLVICEAVIRGGSENPIPQQLLSELVSVPEPPPHMRVMRFWLKVGSSGSKLDYSDVSSLLYTLRVVLGDGGLPTRPPNMELNSLVCGCNATTVSDSDEQLQVRPGAVKVGKGRMLIP
eukprot:GHUV01001239.1.p1 GENE.GHUV01001239.1~~GHUV01001239.1.p1  ORF type:complete len:322 (+),score=48.37 GHUV01001239.1:268-1233(+)